MSTSLEKTKSNRAPWVLVGVLGCLALCLIVVLISGVGYAIFSSNRNTVPVSAPTINAPAQAVATTRAPTPSAPQPSADNLFAAPANPFNVSPQLDQARAVKAIISPEGGKLTATAADGSILTLDIPARALVVPTEITMIPLAAIPDLPFKNGMVAAVQFEPDGLFLYQDAVLTIQPAKTVPIQNQILFGYLGNGKDLYLAIPGTDKNQIKVRVPHFSGFGLGSGVATDRTDLMLRRAADHEARLTQQLAEYLGRERMLALLGSQDQIALPPLPIRDYYQSYYGLVLRPRLLTASSSCANGTAAIANALSFIRQQLLFGTENPIDPFKEFPNVGAQVHAKCRQEAEKSCREHSDPNELISFELAWERQKQLTGSANDNAPMITYEEAYAICGGAFSVNEKIGDLVLSGKICDLTKPFKLTANGRAVLNFNFTPSSAKSGAYNYIGTLVGGPVSFDGGGNYTVNGLETNQPNITASMSGNANTPLGAFGGGSNFQIHLTPLKGGCQ